MRLSCRIRIHAETVGVEDVDKLRAQERAHDATAAVAGYVPADQDDEVVHGAGEGVAMAMIVAEGRAHHGAVGFLACRG